MNGNYGIIKNDFALKIVHEYNAFVRETAAKMDEARRATMISLKKLMKLRNGDIIEIQDDDTLRVVPAREAKNGR
jgi:flagellar motor switch protein FliM